MGRTASLRCTGLQDVVGGASDRVGCSRGCRDRSKRARYGVVFGPMQMDTTRIPHSEGPDGGPDQGPELPTATWTVLLLIVGVCTLWGADHRPEVVRTGSGRVPGSSGSGQKGPIKCPKGPLWTPPETPYSGYRAPDATPTTNHLVGRSVVRVRGSGDATIRSYPDMCAKGLDIPLFRVCNPNNRSYGWSEPHPEPH